MSSDQFVTLLAEMMSSSISFELMIKEFRTNIVALHETTIYDDEDLVTWCR
jgi:hypothetical protein